MEVRLQGLRRARWAAGLVLAVMAAAAVIPLQPSASASTPASFSLYVGAGNPGVLQAVTSRLGVKATFASDAFDETSWSGISDDEWAIHQWQSSGYRMSWAVPILPTTGGVSLATGATGAYDQYFRVMAENLIAAGMGDSILRLGWEFNQSKFPWYAAGQSTAFVTYWSNIVTTMRSVPGADFQFEWNPSQGDNGPKDSAMGNLANYYPGDQYVDIVGMDVYDSAWNFYPGAAAEFQTILGQTWGLDWLANFGAAHDKPLAIPEMGLGSGPSAPNSGALTTKGPVSGGDDPLFIVNMINWIRSNNVTNVFYWDYQTSSIENGQNPLAAEALRQALSTTIKAKRVPRRKH